MKTRTYRPRSTRITLRLKRATIRTIAAMALANHVSFDEQLMVLVRQQLG